MDQDSPGGQVPASERPNALNDESRKTPPGAGDQAVASVPMYRRWKTILPTLIVVLAIAVAAWYWYMGQRDYVSTDDAYIDADRVSVSSKILGRIDRLEADEGDTVSTGEPLVYLDRSDLLAQQSQAHAARVLARENVTLARVTEEKAQEDYDRAKTQYRDTVIPEEQYQHALKALQEAKAKFAIAQAQVGVSEAQIAAIDTQLQNTTIASPMNGVVSKRWVLAGDVISPGQPIFTIYDTDSVWVTANLEETKLSAVKVGDIVDISVDAYPEKTFQGRVEQIGVNTASQFSLIPPNNASGNFTKVTQRIPVKIAIVKADSSEEEAHHLLVGMSVEVRVKVR
jgi:membrane fusion protein (multidrug efflux system)